MILRIMTMARNLQLKTQELHEALQNAHKTMGLDEVGDQPAAANPGLTEQDGKSSDQSNIQPRGQLGLAQSQLARDITNNTLAIKQARVQASDLDDRLKASTALERGFGPLHTASDEFRCS